jgi:hypothetical protein
MAGEPWIDSLAKTLSGDLSRRAVLRWLGVGGAGLLLGTGAAQSAAAAPSPSGRQVCGRTAPCPNDGDDSSGETENEEPHGPCARDTADACGVLCGDDDITHLSCLDAEGAPRIWIDCAGNGALVARCDLEDDVSAQAEPVQGLFRLRATAGIAPGPPAGLHGLLTAQIQLQPLATPNSVTLTLFYPDSDLSGVSETLLRAFYFVDELSVWVELFATVDPALNTVTIRDVDVSAFADRLRWIGIFA